LRGKGTRTISPWWTLETVICGVLWAVPVRGESLVGRGDQGRSLFLEVQILNGLMGGNVEVFAAGAWKFLYESRFDLLANPLVGGIVLIKESKEALLIQSSSGVEPGEEVSTTSIEALHGVLKGCAKELLKLVYSLP